MNKGSSLALIAAQSLILSAQMSLPVRSATASTKTTKRKSKNNPIIVRRKQERKNKKRGRK